MERDSKYISIIILLVVIIAWQIAYSGFVKNKLNSIDEANLMILIHQERLRRTFEEQCK